MVQPNIVWSSVSHFSEVEVGGRSMEKEELVTLILCLINNSTQICHFNEIVQQFLINFFYFIGSC